MGKDPKKQASPHFPKHIDNRNELKIVLDCVLLPCGMYHASQRSIFWGVIWLSVHDLRMTQVMWFHHKVKIIMKMV